MPLNPNPNTENPDIEKLSIILTNEMINPLLHDEYKLAKFDEGALKELKQR